MGMGVSGTGIEITSVDQSSTVLIKGTLRRSLASSRWNPGEVGTTAWWYAPRGVDGSFVSGGRLHSGGNRPLGVLIGLGGSFGFCGGACDVALV
jgi:hypothetical protein